MALYEKSVAFWDKVSPINGNDKEVVFTSYPWARTEPALLVYEDDLDSTQRVERVKVMRRNLGLPKETTDEEVRVALYNDVNKEWLAEQAAKDEEPAK